MVCDVQVLLMHLEWLVVQSICPVPETFIEIWMQREMDAKKLPLYFQRIPNAH